MIIRSNQPLATRLRPKSLNEIVGQSHLIGKGKILSRIVDSNVLTSIILYGPPGTGKTSIAHALSNDLKLEFKYFNASTHSKKELEVATEKASTNYPVIVLIDEVHRLSKPNQDFLLMKMEEGSIVIVGATTENPYMSITPALRSRSKIFELKKPSANDIKEKLKHALENNTAGLGMYNVKIHDNSISLIAERSNGDMRYALNTLEIIVKSTEKDSNGFINLTKENALSCLQSKQIEGDKNGDSHYNTLSAFQKSIRGSDVDASLHYLARLIKVGDLMSINRRLLVIAYEDIGLANPELVSEVLTAVESCERVGFPEAKIILSYIVTRLALSPKSNVTYKAIVLAEKALEINERDTEIPRSLHDTHYNGAKSLNKGEGYKYSHNYPYGIVRQQFLPNDFLNDRYLKFPEKHSISEIEKIYEKINSILK